MRIELEARPASLLHQALLEGKPITESLEQEEWGVAYNYMRSNSLTPLGVADRFAYWQDTRAKQYSFGIYDAMIPTLEEAQQLIALFRSGHYEDIAKALDVKAELVMATLIQEDENFAKYTAENPAELKEYQRLEQLHIDAKQHYSSELARTLADQKNKTPYGSKKKEYGERTEQFRKIYSLLNSSRKVLRGEFIEE